MDGPAWASGPGWDKTTSQAWDNQTRTGLDHVSDLKPTDQDGTGSRVWSKTNGPGTGWDGTLSQVWDHRTGWDRTTCLIYRTTEPGWDGPHV